MRVIQSLLSYIFGSCKERSDCLSSLYSESVLFLITYMSEGREDNFQISWWKQTDRQTERWREKLSNCFGETTWKNKSQERKEKKRPSISQSSSQDISTPQRVVKSIQTPLSLSISPLSSLFPFSLTPETSESSVSFHISLAFLPSLKKKKNHLFSALLSIP